MVITAGCQRGSHGRDLRRAVDGEAARRRGCRNTLLAPDKLVPAMVAVVPPLVLPLLGTDAVTAGWLATKMN